MQTAQLKWGGSTSIATTSKRCKRAGVSAHLPLFHSPSRHIVAFNHNDNHNQNPYSNKIKGLLTHRTITKVGLCPLDTGHPAHKFIIAHTNDTYQANACANSTRCAPSSSSSTPSASTMSMAAGSCTVRRQRGGDSSYIVEPGALRQITESCGCGGRACAQPA